MVQRLSHIILALFFVCSLLSAQPSSAIGGLAGSPLRMGFGARGIAMGNALSSNTSGQISAYYNPALLPFQTDRNLQAALGFLTLDRRLNFLSYGQDIKPTGGIAVSIVNAGVSEIEGRDVNGTRTDTYSTSENAFLFSFGTSMSPTLSAGITLKVLHYSLYQEVRSTTVGVDAGVLFAITDRLHAALVLQDINAKYKWDTTPIFGRRGNTTTEQFPLRRRLSVTYVPSYYNSNISAEIEYVDSTPLARIGVEAYPVNELALRAGVDHIDLSGDILARPSFGFGFLPGIETLRPELHYAFVVEPYAASGIHIISIIVRF